MKIGAPGSFGAYLKVLRVTAGLTQDAIGLAQNARAYVGSDSSNAQNFDRIRPSL